MDALEIGLFQLENLILMKSPFLFFNLAVGDYQIQDQKLLSYVQTASVMHKDRLSTHLKDQNVDQQYPIILLCEDGSSSLMASKELDGLGYSNVYVVEGGLAGLIAEAVGLSSSTK